MSLPDKKSFCPIKVYVRQRPFTKTETENKCSNIVYKIGPRELLLKSGFNERRYVVDHVFGGETSQSVVYSVTVAPMISSILEGYNCTVITYGQTGTGKTHTVFGETKEGANIDFQSDTSAGLISRASDQLFSELSKLNLKTEYVVRISLIEIYNEEVHDLLNGSLSLRVYDDPLNKGSVCMKDLTKVTVFKTEDVYNWLQIGLTERQTAAIHWNLQASRSHTLFTFWVNTKEVNLKGQEIVKTGRLCLVDLVDTENTTRSGAVDLKARALSTLNKVIKALAQKMPHIPYRDSKLTRILNDALGGNTKTLMIATFSPNGNFWNETNTTMEMIQMVKTITNNPQVNIDRKQVDLVKELNDEVSQLKKELAAARGGEGFYVSTETYRTMTQEDKANNQKILLLVRQCKELEDHKFSLDSQYRNLTDSFEKKKKYLEEKQKMLAATEEAIKQEQAKLQEMHLQHRCLSYVFNKLLNMCKITTKSEEIVYQKYQDKCVVNTNNSKLTEEMAVQSLNILNNIILTTQNKLLQNLAHPKVMERLNEQILVQIDDVSHEICTFAKHFQLKRIPENTAKSVQSFVEETYNQSLPHLGNKIVIDLLNKLRENVIAKTSETTAKFEQASSTLRDSICQAEANYATVENSLENMKKGLNRRENQLEEQLEKDEVLDASFKKEFSRAEEEEQVMMTEASHVEKLMVRVALLMEQNNQRNKENQKMKESIADYLQTTNQNLKPVTENAVNDVNQYQNRLRDRGIKSREKIKQYMEEFTGVVQKNLIQKNNEFTGALNGWDVSLENLQGNVDQTKNTAIKIQNTLKQVQKTVQDQHDEVFTCANNTINTINVSKDMVSSMGHTGNTPPRITDEEKAKFRGAMKRCAEVIKEFV